MTIWFAVLSELLDFALVSLGLRSRSQFSPTAIHQHLHDGIDHPSYAPTEVDQLEMSLEDSSDPAITQHAFRSAAEVLSERHLEVQPPSTLIQPGSVGMVAERAAVHSGPTQAFDSVIDWLDPGVVVRIDSVSGHWCSVAYQEKRGWLRQDAIAEHEGTVMPYFILREYCGPEAENTVRLRRYIDDEFSGGASESPLRPEEYIFFMLKQKGLSLPEISQRPRLAGAWHRLFKGQSGVHISVKPKTGSVMEWSTDEEVGRLAYVRSVAPDDTLTVTMVGEPEDGYYLEQSFTQAEWQARSPVFIQFT